MISPGGFSILDGKAIQFKKAVERMPDTIERLRLTEEMLGQSGGRVLHQFGVPSTYRIHSHDFYELFLVPQGSAVHLINGRSQLLTEGSFVLIRPGDVHRYDVFSNADFELLSIGIPATLFARLCEYLQLDRAQFDAPALPLHCVLSGSTLSDVKNKLLKSQRIRDAQAGALYMSSLFPYLVQLFLVSPAPEALLPQWLSALLEKMDEPEHFTAGLPRLLALANMSQEHLTRSFRRYIGLTPTQYINGKRMGMAARLLLEGDLPVIEVGIACGFGSPSRFYRLFTERYGCPPKAFRDRFRAAAPRREPSSLVCFPPRFSSAFLTILSSLLMPWLAGQSALPRNSGADAGVFALYFLQNLLYNGGIPLCQHTEVRA